MTRFTLSLFSLVLMAAPLAAQSDEEMADWVRSLRVCDDHLERCDFESNLFRLVIITSGPGQGIVSFTGQMNTMGVLVTPAAEAHEATCVTLMFKQDIGTIAQVTINTATRAVVAGTTTPLKCRK